jgi:hypothetical protein
MIFPFNFFKKKNAIPKVLSEDKHPLPTFPNVVWQMCTGQQCETQEYINFLIEIKHEEWQRYNRKLWEWAYICQALKEHNVIFQGSKGLGFAVGTEPVTAYLVKRGSIIVATDLDTEEAIKKGWKFGNQHAEQIANLNDKNICPVDIFENNTSFRFVDMNNIPADLKDFNFTWSACSLEHLGSLQKGMDFIYNSLKCLRPGGIAVHTTEFNISSNMETVSEGPTVLYRKQDILAIAKHLRNQGYWVAPITFNAGSSIPDRYVDLPPYYSHKKKYHLRLLHNKYAITSFGMIIKK